MSHDETLTEGGNALAKDTLKKKNSWLNRSAQADVGRKKIDSSKNNNARRDAPWETDLLEVYGKRISLSHPYLSSGEVSLEYGLSPSVVPLQEGITARPGRAFGQVSVYDDEAAGTRSVIFNAAGGTVEFAPPNLGGIGALGELAVATVVAEEPIAKTPSEKETVADQSAQQLPDPAELKMQPAENGVQPNQDALQSTSLTGMAAQGAAGGTTEISLRLKEPLVIQPLKEFRMELGEAEYVKRKNQGEPKLKFHKTKLSYDNRPLAADFETVSDERGLHFPDGKTAVGLDLNVLQPGRYGVTQETVGVNLLLDDAGVSLELLSRSNDAPAKERLHQGASGAKDTKPLVKELWTSQAEVAIGEAKFFLHGVRKSGGKVIAAEEGRSSFHSFDLRLREIQVNDQEALSGEVVSMLPLTNPNITIQCGRVSCDKERGIETEFAMLKRGKQEYELNGVTFGEDEKIFAKTLRSEINGYNATLYNATIRSYGEISYEKAEVKTVLHYGLNKGDKDAVYNENAQAFFTFQLDKGSVFNDQFGVGTQALKLASKQRRMEQGLLIGEKQKKTKKKDGKKEKTAAKQKRIPLGDTRSSEKIEGDIFTDDGFVQLEDAVFDFRNDSEEAAAIKGRGGFRLLAIPYNIVVPGKERPLEGTTQEKKDPEDVMDFTVSEDGKITAEFEDSIELPMLKHGNEAESIVRTLTLENAAIEDGVLTAKSVRVDQGLGGQLDLEDITQSETAQKLFGAGVKMTMAYVGGKAELIRDKGVTGNTETKRMGQFEVSDFLGFLDISGDYGAGKFHAALKKGEEEENEHSTKLFGEKNKYVTDAGLSIPLAGPLSFDFGVTTSLGVGGELSADLEREDGKSFGEEMASDQTMALEGELKVEGSASVGVSAGLAVGISALITNLLSADLKLNANLSAAFETMLKGGTALGKEDGKLKQAKNLEVEGGLDATLKGELNLTSDIKFLIWKGNIFTLELGKKTIKLEPVHGKGVREVDPQNPKNAWNFESLDLSAEAFGKKAGLALKEQKKAKQEPLAVTAAKVNAMGEDAKGAWTILEDLKREQKLNKERVYFMEKSEQTALNERIRIMTATVQEKLTNYVSKLNEYKEKLESEEADAKRAVETARDEQLAYQQRDDVRQQTLKNTATGGFDLSKYKQTAERDLSQLIPEKELVVPKTATGAEKTKIKQKNEEISARNKKLEKKREAWEKYNKGVRAQNKHLRQMASIDFAIARILGIYDNAVRYVEDSYDVYSEVQNLKMLAKNKETPDSDLFKKREDMKPHEFLYGTFGTFGSNLEQLEYLTRFGEGYESYFKALSVGVWNHGGDPEKELGIYGTALWKLGSKNQPVLDGRMDGYRMLRIILEDKYPKGTCDPKKKDANGKPLDLSGGIIGGMPEQKLKALKYLFKGKEKKESLYDALFRSVLGEKKKKNRQESMLDDTDEIYRALFESDVQTMTNKGNVDIGEKLAELDQNLAKSKEKYLSAVKMHLDAQSAVAKVRAEQAECEAKLAKLQRDVATGVTLQGQAVAAATGAVDFMAKDYDEIESGKSMMDALQGNPAAKGILESVK